MRLRDRGAIVTGASRGIGRSIAELFAQEGASLAINYVRSRKQASHLADKIRNQGGQSIHLRADMSKPKDVKRLIKTTLEKFGRVDILVNDAGVHFTDDFLEAKEDAWDKTMDINLKGAYLCSKEVAPIMVKQKKGKIIIISSNSGLYHRPQCATLNM